MGRSTLLQPREREEARVKRVGTRQVINSSQLLQKAVPSTSRGRKNGSGESDQPEAVTVLLLQHGLSIQRGQDGENELDYAVTTLLQYLSRVRYAHRYAFKVSRATVQPCSTAVGWIPAAVGRLQHLQEHRVRDEGEDKVLTHLSSELTFDVHPELSRHGFCLDSGDAGQAAPPKAAV